MLQHRKRNLLQVPKTTASTIRTCQCRCNGIVAHGAEGMVHDITIKDTYIFYNQKAKDIDETCKIKLENVNFATFAK